MGSQLERQRQEEEVNKLILGSKDDPTLYQENIGDDEDEGIAPEGQQGTPPEQKPVEATAKPDDSEEQTYKAKYQVLAGKYNAEVPRLQSRIQELEKNAANADTSQYETKIQNLEAQVTELKAKLDKPADNSDIGMDDVEAKLRDEYGDELANMITGLISKHRGGQSSNDDVARLSSDVNELKQSAQQQAFNNKVQSLTAILEAKSVSFKDTDEDPLFHDWLAQHMPQTGQPRQYFLNQAFNRGDLKTVAEFYTDFKAQERSKFNDNPLSDHIDASQNHGAPDSGSEQETWTVAEMEAFYADVRKRNIGTGPLRDKPQSYIDELEQSLQRAMQSGRLVQ